MAIRAKAKKKSTPKGITLRKDGLYIIRKTYKGQKAEAFAHTLKEAKQKLADIEYELQHGTYFAPQKVTLNDWFNTWITDIKRSKIKHTTIASYTSYYKHWSIAIGNLLIGDITASHIRHVLNQMVDDDYSQTSIHTTYVILNQMLKQAYKEDMIKKNPCDAIDEPKGKQSEPHVALTVDQQALFVQALPEDSIYTPLAKLMLYTGMRYGECAGLQWSDIEADCSIIHVRHTVHVVDGKDVLTTPKTKKSVRNIEPIDKAKALLQTLRKANNKVVRFPDSKSESPSSLVLNKNGRILGLTQFNRFLKDVCNSIITDGQNDFPVITSHCLRHTFATRAIEYGMQPQILRDILGHSSLAMTMDLYAHVMPDQRMAEMNKIAVAF